ncbi:Smr/MutS family protein [Paracoccaceae bacterium]|nr:Smr/MutS family protein [Paracoccaceae bacterium]
MKKGRILNHDEKELWNKVSESVQKSKEGNADKTLNEEKNTKILKKETSIVVNPVIWSPHPITSEKTAINGSKSMDQKALKKLKKGKFTPEAKLDLHGLTSEQAHRVLMPFIINSYKQNKRLVLVITGKGEKNNDNAYGSSSLGVLKKKVPQWLRLQPVNDCILDFVEAHQKDGGSGALYVYLKKNKKLIRKHV